MKQTIIQCVTAIICVVAVAVTSVISIGKISTAKVDAAKAAAANSSTSGEPSADPSADPSVNPANPADPAADPSATDPSNPADPAATDPANPASPATPATPSASKPGTSGTASKVPSTAADIAAYYNAAVNKAVNSKAGFSKKRVTSISNLNGGKLMEMKIVVDTVNDFLGVGTTNYKNTKGKVGEISKASLSANDISSPTCKQSGDNYVITMTLKNGTSKASSAGKSDSTALARTGLYSGVGDKKAYDYKNAGNIFDGLNNADGASVESVVENNKNIKISATINSKTGNLVSLHISYDWDVALTKVKYTIVTIKSATGDAKTSVDFTNFVF